VPRIEAIHVILWLWIAWEEEDGRVRCYKRLGWSEDHARHRCFVAARPQDQ
jgi:hypothetical protein